MTVKLRAVEPRRERDRRLRRPGSWSQPAPAPVPTRAEMCGLCKGFFLDTEDGRRAHVVVMEHQPVATPTEEEPG